MLRFAKNQLFPAVYATTVLGFSFFCAEDTERKNREFLDKNPDKQLVTTYSLFNGCPVPSTRVVARPKDPGPSSSC